MLTEQNGIPCLEVTANSITVALKISVYDEYINSYPEKAVVTLSRSEIISLADKAKEIKNDGWYKISKFDYRAEYKTLDWDAADDAEKEPTAWRDWTGSDLGMLTLRNNGTVSFGCVIKHTTVQCETTAMNLTTLIKIMNEEKRKNNA